MQLVDAELAACRLHAAAVARTIADDCGGRVGLQRILWWSAYAGLEHVINFVDLRPPVRLVL